MIDPMEQFIVKPIIPLSLLGYDISLTNSSLFMLITTFLIIALFYFGISPRTMIPHRLQIVLEKTYRFIDDTLINTVGEEARSFFPFIFSLFLFISCGNLLGLLPYSFLFTGQLVLTLALGFTVFLMVTIVGFIRHGAHYLRLFFPENVPIYIVPFLVPVEILSYCARPLTLAIRLFSNMVAGSVMLKIFAGFVMILSSTAFFPLAALPFILNIILFGLKVFVALLQAYVFTILSCLYLNDAIHMH